SALVFLPLCLLTVEIERHFRQATGWRETLTSLWTGWRSLLGDGCQIGLLGLVILFVLVGSDFQAERTFVDWAHALPDSSFKGTAIWLAENVRVFTNAGEGLAQQIKHNLRGHGVFLLGEGYPRAVWYYFPVLASIKLPLAVLIGVLALLLFRPRQT